MPAGGCGEGQPMKNLDGGRRRMRGIARGANPIARIAVAMLLTLAAAPDARAQSLHGDVNCDGRIDLLDLQSEVDALFLGSACGQSDVNGDGRSSAADLPKEVGILSSTARTPTPSVVAMTPTATPTGPTPTITPSRPSATATRTPTGSPPIPTRTATATASGSRTALPTATPTAATPSVTAATGTVSPSVTPTVSAGNTASATPSPSRTSTPPGAPTPSLTSSPTTSLPSATTTQTGTPTATQPGPPGTPTFTVTPSRTATRTPTPTPVLSPTTPGASTLGPSIVAFAALRPNGCLACAAARCECGASPTPTPEFDTQGRRVFRRNTGAAFVIVVEAQSGGSGSLPGTRKPQVCASGQRPDLQIESSHDLGSNPPIVCPPVAGVTPGVQGFPTPDFGGAQEVTNALQDFAGRFEASTGEALCTYGPDGLAGFLSGQSSGVRQYCHIVDEGTRFPSGDTVLTVQVNDSLAAPNVGSTAQIVVRVPP
jgi:hypothetical protein